jgi:hypothetical protein
MEKKCLPPLPPVGHIKLSAELLKHCPRHSPPLTHLGGRFLICFLYNYFLFLLL